MEYNKNHAATCLNKSCKEVKKCPLSKEIMPFDSTLTLAYAFKPRV